MDYQGILVVVTLIITLTAIARPIQRKTLRIFVPIWLIVVAIISAIGIIIFRSAINSFQWELYPWSDFLTELLAFIIPIICISISLFLWYRAKISQNKDDKFRKFIQTSINEGKFDELKRILERNVNRIEEVLELDTINLLYNRRILDSLNINPDWLFLKLLSKECIRKNNKLIFTITDVLVYDLIQKEDSILKRYISRYYGGNEHVDLHEYEFNLIEETFQNPIWYMNVRADYCLLMIARDAINSGSLDESYNQSSDLYVSGQGKSERYDCPIHIAIKVHVLMLKQAIEKSIDRDFYVSNLFHIFQFCVNHCEYSKAVWDDPDANIEYPTPFAYLMKEILHDFREFLSACLITREGREMQLPDDVVRMYAVSINWLVDSNNRVSDNFKIGCLRDYFEYVMELRHQSDRPKEHEKNEKRIAWSESLIKDLYKLCNSEVHSYPIILDAIQKLDRGKQYVLTNLEWLIDQLCIEK